MAAFRGGPALPKRSDAMTSTNTTKPDSSPTKRKQRTTPLLSNRPDEDEYETSTTIGTDGENDRIKTDSSNVGTTIPLSNVRSTSHAATSSVDMDTDDDLGGMKTRPRKVTKTDSAQDAMEAGPSTPKKSAARTAAGSSKESKTPPKKQSVSAPTTPRSGEPAGAWSPAHWDDLNFAILKVVHEHASELYDASPSLAPWRVKGRLLVKLRQLLKESSGGDVASKRWDTELKPVRGKNSPKKQGP